jgi:hypothetical protein
MKYLIPLLVLFRIITNDGLFSQQRKFPIKRQPPEIIRVVRKQGKKHFKGD